MSLIVERKLTQLDLKADQRLARQIKVLEENGDPKSVFNDIELRELKISGHAEYLAYLRRIRESLGKEDLGE